MHGTPGHGVRRRARVPKGMAVSLTQRLSRPEFEFHGRVTVTVSIAMTCSIANLNAHFLNGRSRGPGQARAARPVAAANSGTKL